MPTNLIIGGLIKDKLADRLEQERLYQIGTQLVDQINEQGVRADTITTKIDRIENIYTMNSIKQRTDSMTEEILDRLYNESESLESEIRNLTDQYNAIRQHLEYRSQDAANYFEAITQDLQLIPPEEVEQKEEDETLQEEKEDDTENAD